MELLSAREGLANNSARRRTGAHGVLGTKGFRNEECLVHGSRDLPPASLAATDRGQEEATAAEYFHQFKAKDKRSSHHIIEASLLKHPARSHSNFGNAIAAVRPLSPFCAANTTNTRPHCLAGGCIFSSCLQDESSVTYFRLSSDTCLSSRSLFFFWR